MGGRRGRHAKVLPGPLPALLLGLAGAGLAGLAALPGGSTAQAGAVTAQSAAQPVALPLPVVGVEERRQPAASRRRPTTPQPEPASAKPVPVAPPAPAAPVLPGCAGNRPDLDGFGNGRLPMSVLCTLPGESGERLRSDAAISFVRLAGAYQQAFGRPICVTDGYRTLGEQQTLRRMKPRYAARPGSSQHGWGQAVDLACGVQSFRTAQHAWLADNADRYGWYLPEWAGRGGSRPEPWHWEYRGE